MLRVTDSRKVDFPFFFQSYKNFKISLRIDFMVDKRASDAKVI